MGPVQKNQTTSPPPKQKAFALPRPLQIDAGDPITDTPYRQDPPMENRFGKPQIDGWHPSWHPYL